MRRFHRSLFVAIPLIAVIVALAALALAQAQPKPAPAEQSAALAAAAADVLQVLSLRLEAGEPLTPSFVELQCEWSRRAYFAQVAAMPAKEARVKAAKEHLARVEGLRALLEGRFRQGLDVSRVQIAQATYYVREAELWLTRAQAE
jgi:hypothetical protein